MIVDTHTHLWQGPQQLGEGMAARVRSMGGSDRFPEADRTAHIDAMEPVDAALVLGFTSRLLGADTANETLAEHVKAQPGRLFGMPGIDPMDPAWPDRIGEAVGRGMAGIVVSPAGQGFHPAHTQAMRVFERCADEGLAVFVWVYGPLAGPAAMEYAPPYLLDEVARSFPGLSLLIGDCGYPWTDQTLALAAKHEHVFAELGVLTARPWVLYNTLVAAHQMEVIDRMLLGSSFPFNSPSRAIETIYSLNRYTQGNQLPSVPRERLRAIVERDALSCLRIQPEGRQKRTAALPPPARPPHEPVEGGTR